MAHKMKSNDVQLGLSMAWHGLTQILSVITGLPFELIRVACEMEGQAVEGWNWIVGSDDRQVIGKPIANSFQFLSNARWFEIAQNSVLSLIPGAVIESAGTFDGRAKRYLTIRLHDKRETFKIGDREFQNRLNIQGAIDGTMQDIVKGSSTCIVCANTFAMSLADAAKGVRMQAKHTKNHADRWAEMETEIEAFFNRSAEFERLMVSAEEMPVSEERAHMALLGWLTEGKATSTRTLGTADRMRELFLTGKGNRGQTGLDLISAVTDYYSHESSGKADDVANRMKQFTSSEIGAGAKAKDSFLEEIRTMDYRFNKQKLGSLVKMGELSLSLSE
jgi:hypothetical protein